MKNNNLELKLKNFNFLFAFFLLFIFIFNFHLNSTSVDIATGLVSHWKLDETTGTIANDSVGTSDGTLKKKRGDREWSKDF